ncbi:4Fe-4S dicluster domain-containing protein [Marinilabiliaceae bacterium JC017]|nr:4Fe-4S dicluster domain-containing protein [Marinilabiliaceae bacterium JC017]
MVKFGFSVKDNREINLDEKEPFVIEAGVVDVAEVDRCIFCGACSAVCPQLFSTGLSFRKQLLSARRGLTSELKIAAGECLMCNKCQLVCPRDINIRAIWLNLLTSNI